MASGTVGPEPITAGSSPGTSLIARVTTRAGAAAAARRPPLIADRCFRTAFISVMLAPQASSARLTACLSASVRPGAGAASRAEAPPDISAMTRSSSVRFWTRSSSRLRAAFAVFVGDRVGGFDDLDAAGRDGVAVAGDDGALQRDVGPGVFQRGGHDGGGFAAADHDAAAGRRFRRQMAGQHGPRVGGRDGGIEQGAQGGAGGRVVPGRGLGHRRFPLCFRLFFGG